MSLLQVRRDRKEKPTGRLAQKGPVEHDRRSLDDERQWRKKPRPALGVEGVEAFMQDYIWKLNPTRAHCNTKALYE